MTTAIAQRDQTGRYLKGHGLAGPGNPHANIVTRLRRELFEYADNHNVVEELLTTAYDLLRDGKGKDRVEAMKFWAQYLFGKPDQNISLDVSTNDPRPTLDLSQCTPEEQEQIRATMVLVASRQIPAN